MSNQNQRIMKHLFLSVAALLLMSCADCTEDYSYQYTRDDYCEMFAFVEYLHETELFGVAEPERPTYDELMLIAASVIVTDTFGDTLSEGDCSKVYFLMYDYFRTMHPGASVTAFLQNIIDHELY